MTNPLPINTDTLLILEKSFETSETVGLAIENLNVLEQLLIGITEYVNQSYQQFLAKFICRRFPVFMIPFITRNEYAILLDGFQCTLSSPNTSSLTESVWIDGKQVKVQLGHTEVYKTQSRRLNSSVDDTLSSSKSILSHDIFARYVTAFTKGFEAELERIEPKADDLKRVKVQLIAPHLVHPLVTGSDMSKIFNLIGPDLVISQRKKSKCKLSVNYEESLIKLELEGTEVTLRPSLFLNHGYPRLCHSIVERIPLFHPCVLPISESLTKGCFLFPTSYETLWTIQFWPSESHLIFSYHPNSILIRIFKLFGAFCLNPFYFWDILNSTFLIGQEDLDELKSRHGIFTLPSDYMVSSFLHEVEQLPEITDWSPKNFSNRFTNLLRGAIGAIARNYHSHYFTRRNVLRKVGKNVTGTPHEEDGGTMKSHHSYRHGTESINTNPFDSDDEFGLHFDELSLQDYRDDDCGFLDGMSSRLDSNGGSKEAIHQKGGTKESRRGSGSLSKYIGTQLRRRLSLFGNGHEDKPSSSQGGHGSMTELAMGFEGAVNQHRREQTFSKPRAPMASVECSETSFIDGQKNDDYQGIDNEAFRTPSESLYSILLSLLNEISPSNHLSNSELITHLDNSRRVLASQNELITAWTQVMADISKPKHICPHAFNPRQIQSISLVIQAMSRSTFPGTRAYSARIPTWEIVGDILRIALYQIRSEGRVIGIGGTSRDSYRPKRRRTLGLSFQTRLRPTTSFTEGGSRPNSAQSEGHASNLSLRSSTASYDVCKHHREIGGLDAETEASLALQDSETAATHRLLQWLWQLRNSEIGRLSLRARKYIEALWTSSLIQSHFLEEYEEARTFETMAIRSAVAVSRIMADSKYPAHVPLLTASKRGWQWAEMILSFVAWNEDKTNFLKAQIPLVNSEGDVIKELHLRTAYPPGRFSGQQTLKKIQPSIEPDTDALSLAFHSELATPLGMHDFEEPLRPGPFSVPILIYTSMGYYSRWEVVPGNIVHALLRLQKFGVLQHLATLLLAPHRKTAVNEVRKLNKSLALSVLTFEDNVMTKTFKRLASLRHTRRLFSNATREVLNSCEEVGCNNSDDHETLITIHKGRSVNCTRL